jgi:hypothetical protein
MRRHRVSRLAQLVVDQLQAFARTEPDTACPLLPGTDAIRLDVWIKQPHRRIEMCEIGLLLRKLSLKLTY